MKAVSVGTEVNIEQRGVIRPEACYLARLVEPEIEEQAGPRPGERFTITAAGAMPAAGAFIFR